MRRRQCEQLLTEQIRLGNWFGEHRCDRVTMTADPVDPLWLRPVAATAPVMNMTDRAGADVRQAQAFIAILEAEMADLQSQLARIDDRVRAGRPGAHHHQSAVRLRVTEVRRLLDALIFRFPSA
ncbi:MULTISPECIES: hypothetical protein [Mycolicibacterium]|uniref:Uncharacterized protein n=1 Tax=Mycolicibacterium senegalense TaxID=1796 RepID=A0A378W883_9MYCO|nr:MULTISPECIES: hypothetical protein [Mycolicibacterium]MCV7333542.1 hypothetical protein [Mycolicibacterium senegalense]MDR7288013.1 hypothetical protein [Mycolicibacterium senegalense]QZA25005.1 hypothetical protein K3U95_02505 [Mycolicibacterium senegalense]CDP86219.1 hypothetical protein BN975_02774 [Mycolicibacterium farcinogenes]SUA28411.1 Uncharacterised protein [Mycolicibacterium senegalense]